ncbi:hypothetical protein GCM10022419_059790 [Nonomuraea rosea]|uniref:Secreted protein n=1 Tax=Nonomuraea rosea TaxID=638574 RepID=A0ABP6XT46_9ACTN
MFSRTKRIFGIAALTMVAAGAATAVAAPAHAGDEYSFELQLLRELEGPFCLPSSGIGIPIVDAVLPQLMACASASFLD